MNLLIYADFPYWGGAPLALLKIAKGLSRLGVAVRLMGRMSRQIYISVKDDPSFESVLPLEGNNIRTCLSKIKPSDVDVILGSSLQPDFGCAKIAQTLNRPLVWRMMGDPRNWSGNQRPLGPLQTREIIQTIGLFSHKIITVSDYLKGLFADQGFKAHTIYNGCDSRLFKPDSYQRKILRKQMGLSPQETAIGLIANFHPHKNHEALISALALLRPKNRYFKAYFIGGAFGQKMLARQNKLKKSVSRLNLQKHILFFDFQKNMPAVYNALDVVAFPFIDEGGCSNALLEAMACEKIIVANTSGSFPEIISHGREGLLVPPQDPDALSESLKWIVANKVHAAAMGIRARKRILKRHTAEQMLFNYKKILIRVSSLKQ